MALEVPSSQQVRLESRAAGLGPGGRRRSGSCDLGLLPAPGVSGEPPPPWSPHVSDATLRPLESASDVTTAFPACPPHPQGHRGIPWTCQDLGSLRVPTLSWAEAAESLGLLIYMSLPLTFTLRES